jgi:hypothetical protein
MHIMTYHIYHYANNREIIQDPFGWEAYTYILFLDNNGEGGIYTDHFSKAIRLAFLSITEIFVALRIKHQVRGMIKGVQPVAVTNTAGVVIHNNEGTAPTAGRSVAKTKELVKSNVSSPSKLSSITSVAPAPLVIHSSSTGKAGKVDTLAEYKLNISRKLIQLSNYMIVSGMVMVTASVIISVGGLSTTWYSEVSNPYILNCMRLLPFMLLQISSMMEVASVDEVLRKMR